MASATLMIAVDLRAAYHSHAAKELASQPRLIGVERCAMHRMHDGRHADRIRRHASQHAPLGTVRVHDVGSKTT